MLDLGPHASFIVTAYSVTALALGALTLVTFGDDREQRRKLAELERQGIRRRSATKPATSTAKSKTRTPTTAKTPAKRKATTSRARKPRS